GYYYFQALVVPLEAEPFMVTRLLEDSNVQTRTWIDISRPYADTTSPMGALAYAFSEFGLNTARIGFEKHCYFFRATEQEELFAAMPHAAFFDCSGMVEQLRLIKSDAEIEIMRLSARATEAGMIAGIDAVAEGVTENDVAAEIHYAMIKAGGEYPAISPFVASGWRCAVGHSTWEGRVIQRGEVAFLEVGGCVHRYHTAMMRTVMVGELHPAIEEAERLIDEALDAAIDAMRPGVAAGDIDASCRHVLSRYSHGGTQATRSGYSIGIAFAPDWGEGHILSIQPAEPRYLEENMTFHLIPWLQVPGTAGIGLSETVRVTQNGAERFTHLERKVFCK
ncbi:MAG: aminopeptidase P family protein, partial [Myxococcales bacterium]|nr:aminopeptidase P family protein [Myxococcales bacterium]